MNNFEIRDQRGKDRFYTDDFYLDMYAKKCGIYATGVYMSLCRHSNREQSSWPSLEKIAEELDISKKQVGRSIKILEKYHIVLKQRMGKKLNNRYLLLNKSEWTDSPVSEGTTSPLTRDHQSTHIGTDSPLHSKETQFKETQEEGITPLPPKGDAAQSAAERRPLTDLFYKTINPNIKWENKTNIRDEEFLLKKHGLEKCVAAINFLVEHWGNQMLPTITTPSQLREKMAALVKFKLGQGQSPGKKSKIWVPSQ